MRKVYCDYCGREAELVDSKVVIGKGSGKYWLCRPCMAYVGCQKGTVIPTGRLANAELRQWKQIVHQAFDPLWKRGSFKGYRDVAYAWLFKKMGLPAEKAHIGMFDVAECRKALSIIEAKKRSRHG